MKKLCSLIIAAVLLVPVLVFAAEPSVDSHPILKETNWTLVSRSTDFRDDIVMEGYENKDRSYLMLVDTYLGEEVIRRYFVRKDSKMVLAIQQVKIQDEWRIITNAYFDFEKIRDESGKLSAIVIIVKDNTREFFRREVKRK
ncbi:MAG: hypothetical protein A3G49_06275 [Candidatus Sungbacteria bacterium RIFCSPLOWO2_12_FULL_41_11]|uniref:Uncharacterized protein n=1 Tax=Candidatus Sungbacteria bacterium RIFCSPLOWO2_12_FULL_41_11 TaxID=1802286 RepID=A0A1G2LS28_9BACT|nr:MAG: hypothetical protein A3D41_03755 [Candidatus Sungbacteria bacterium RIFCSPHIGHO2_02_FULL_41_12b]OHA14426.1 MAG: hypothetical protein A3G49_06275 [Candidatus Sungbacteria bacterium RIFCSPLOWO2_12_FULL_41_11]